jgi:plasmid stabilization system protein ParE
VTISWSNAARHDVTRIFAFNAAYVPGCAAVIDGRLFEGADQCARNPLAGLAIAGTAIRKRSLTDIQYVIGYKADARDAIIILGIRHARENRDTA